MQHSAADNFSYANPDDPWFKRLVIRAIERITGQPHLKSLYDAYRANRESGENFWDAAVRRLKLNIVVNPDGFGQLPATGPLVVVANHPYGVLDGVVISHLVNKVRPDFLVLTNEVLTRAEEVRPYLLPIDFAESEAALKTNLQSRARAKAHLAAGGCLIVFPAGGVSTTPTPFARQAIDAEWKKFTGRLILQCKADVVPIYFAGQNSWMFQIASHISMTLRLSLIFKEVYDRIGTDLHVRIGERVPYERLAGLNDRTAFMEHLRELTYRLGEGANAPPKTRRKKRRSATV